MKIDIYNHVMPQAYLDLVKQHSKEPGMVKRMSNLRMLWDIEHRVASATGSPWRTPGLYRFTNRGPEVRRRLRPQSSWQWSLQVCRMGARQPYYCRT